MSLANAAHQRVKGPKFRRKLFAVVIAMLALTVLSLPPAANAGQQLDWGDGTDFHVFGPNESVVIDTGQMEVVSDCASEGHDEYIDDVPLVFTDIYVVRSGTTALSGVPNTVQGASDGSFVSELIATTAPGGSLGNGTYAVIYDECQDGFFDPGVDFVADPAIQVSVASGVPPLPSLTAFKADAAEQASHWEEAHLAFHALFILAKVIDGATIAGRVDAFLFGFNLVALHPFEDLALKAAENTYKHYRGLAADPPDPDFQQLAPLPARDVLDAESQDPLLVRSADLGTEVGSEGVLAELS